MQSKTLRSWLFRLALAVNIGLAISYLLLGILAVKNDLIWRADFTAFYTGGAIVRDGLGGQLYDLELQARYQQDILDGPSFMDGVMPFNYPPHSALIFSLLAYLPLKVAYSILLAVQMMLLAGTLHALWQIGASWTIQERLLVMSGFLGFLPLLSSILLGAFSLLVLYCFIRYYGALKKHSDFAAGLWLLPASLKPQTAVLPGLMLLFARRRQAWIAIAVGGLGLVTGTAICLHPQIWIDFVDVLRTSSSFFDKYGIYPATMYNLKGTLTIWLGKSNASQINVISLVAFLLSIGVTAWLWRGRWQPDKPDFTLRMAITLTLGVLFGMHVNPQDGLLLVAPAVLFYDYLRRGNLSHRAYGIFLWACLPVFLLDQFAVQDRLGIRLPVIAMLILLGWLGKAYWEQR